MGLMDGYLPPEFEAQFQRDLMFAPGWRDWRKNFIRDQGGSPNTEPGGDYNYRLAWATGSTPQLHQPSGAFHGMSSAQVPPFKDPVQLKAGDHPTAWKEGFMNLFGADPDTVENFTPEMQEFIGKLFPSPARGLME